MGEVFVEFGAAAAPVPSSAEAQTVARSFAESAVREIMQRDAWWNGALLGASLGAGLALWDYFIDPIEPGNAAISAIAVDSGSARPEPFDTVRPEPFDLPLVLSPSTSRSS